MPAPHLRRAARRLGTLVVELETNDVIDLLPDRDASTVRSWLEAHPGVELVSRDHSSAYSQAASKAQPVADRWHLLKNVREAIERVFERVHELRRQGTPIRQIARELHRSR